MLTVKPNGMLKLPITIVYGGDADFHSSTSAATALAQASLKSLARPMRALRHRGRGRR